MKTLLCFLLAAGFGTLSFADIQDPPMNDFGPTRKLGRALANIFEGVTELPSTIAMVNYGEGNSAASSYGVIKGFGRWFFRFGAGWYELVTFPFPTYKGSYRPFYRSNIPWIHGGWEEFPPELGFDTRFNYNRENSNVSSAY